MSPLRAPPHVQVLLPLIIVTTFTQPYLSNITFKLSVLFVSISLQPVQVVTRHSNIIPELIAAYTRNHVEHRQFTLVLFNQNQQQPVVLLRIQIHVYSSSCLSSNNNRTSQLVHPVATGISEQNQFCVCNLQQVGDLHKSSQLEYNQSKLFVEPWHRTTYTDEHQHVVNKITDLEGLIHCHHKLLELIQDTCNMSNRTKLEVDEFELRTLRQEVSQLTEAFERVNNAFHNIWLAIGETSHNNNGQRQPVTGYDGHPNSPTSTQSATTDKNVCNCTCHQVCSPIEATVTTTNQTNRPNQSERPRQVTDNKIVHRQQSGRPNEAPHHTTSTKSLSSSQTVPITRPRSILKRPQTEPDDSHKFCCPPKSVEFNDEVELKYIEDGGDASADPSETQPSLTAATIHDELVADQPTGHRFYVNPITATPHHDELKINVAVLFKDSNEYDSVRVRVTKNYTGGQLHAKVREKMGTTTKQNLAFVQYRMIEDDCRTIWANGLRYFPSFLTVLPEDFKQGDLMKVEFIGKSININGDPALVQYRRSGRA